MLKWILCLKDVDWINPAQDRDQWWAYASLVISLRVPLKAVNFLSD
jgi:hypothetical protein